MVIANVTMDTMECIFEDCDRTASKRGWCRSHYAQWRRTGKTWVIGSNPNGGKKVCVFPECSRPNFAYGYCGGHAKQIRNGQTPHPIRLARPEDTTDSRWCSTCKEYKDKYLFPGQPTGRMPRTCDDCAAKRMREYNTRPEVKVRRRLRRIFQKYGVTQEQYQGMWNKQTGICAICKEPLGNITSAKVAVDHDHQTGAVRGLLCNPCNLVLGLANDDPLRLEAAAAYLRPVA